MQFENREQAANELIQKLKKYEGVHPLVLGIPRGGVPMARLIADALQTDVDVMLVHKISAPDNPEFAIGSVSETGDVYFSENIGRYRAEFGDEVKKSVDDAIERLHFYRKRFTPGRENLSLQGRTVILVDDGLATGSTMLAAVRTVRMRRASRVVVAAPVASTDAMDLLRPEADDLVVPDVPEIFFAIGEFFRDFRQVNDDEVLKSLMKETKHKIEVTDVDIELEDVRLAGTLSIAPRNNGLVIFAHGSGSSRFSPRNQKVASILNEDGISTLLIDLLTNEESSDREKVFDIPFLAKRLALVTQWAIDQGYARGIEIGYFGASTGAGAALWAAADMVGQISAIVSRGGRPDLAAPRLEEVDAPTLLIVGGNDEAVIEMNREALKYLNSAEMVIVPGATHLFEEPGALEEVALHAANWFRRHLKKGALKDAVNRAA